MQTPFAVLNDFCARSLGAFSQPRFHFNADTERRAVAEDGGFVCVVAVYDWEGRYVWAHGAACQSKKEAKHSAADYLLRNFLMKDEDLPYDLPARLRRFVSEHEDARGRNSIMVSHDYGVYVKYWILCAWTADRRFISRTYYSADLHNASARLLEEMFEAKNRGIL